MRSLNMLLIFTFFVFTVFLSGCDSSSDDYFFEQPSAVSFVKNVKCVNGSVSYMGFVVDNTKTFGARVMKISGCGIRIDKDFDDALDGRTGLYINGNGLSVDHVIVDDEIIIAVASSGYVEYEHWKRKEENLKLAEHSGRIVLRKLDNDFDHDPSFDRSVLLDFHPSEVKKYGTEGFFYYGSRFGRNYIGFVNAAGEGNYEETEIKISGLAVSGDDVFILESVTGRLFTVDGTLKTVEVLSSERLKDAEMSEIYGDRLVFYKENETYLYTSKMLYLGTVNAIEGSDISAVGSVKYHGEHLFRQFNSEMMQTFVQIYEKEIDYTENDDSDIDIAEDISEPDDDSEIPDENFSTMDASEGDIIWIATKSGNVMVYDISTLSWLVKMESDLNPVYYNEMVPYVNSTHVSYPEFGQTNSSNIPDVSSISAKRCLPSSITYSLVFEGIIEGTESNNGELNEERTVISDKSVDFSRYDIDPSVDKVVFLNRKASKDCMIPLNVNAVFDITGVISSSELGVNIDKYSDQLENCYGTPFKYGVFPRGMYSVSRESYSGTVFAGRGKELSRSDDGGDISFEDEYAKINIVRKSDDVATVNGMTFYIKLSPGIPFAGFSSSDIMTGIFNPSKESVLMFSPLTRRIVEYDTGDESFLKIYK